MKLNLHAKEYLALFNLLQLVVDKPTTTEVGMLNEVRNRMRSHIISALQQHPDGIECDDRLSQWELNQKKKLADLKSLDAELKTASKDPDYVIPKQEILRIEGDELDAYSGSYPKTAQGNSHRQGKQRGGRK